MNLQENIQRIKQVMGLNESLEKVDHKDTLYHLSNYKNRENIKTNGLDPRVGKKTSNWQELHKTEGLEKFVYVMSHEPSMLEKSMYGFDVWEIDQNGLDLELFSDPNHTEFGGWLVTKSSIPASNLKLIDSDEKYDDCSLKNYDEDNKPEYCSDLDIDKLLGL